MFKAVNRWSEVDFWALSPTSWPVTQRSWIIQGSGVKASNILDTVCGEPFIPGYGDSSHSGGNTALKYDPSDRQRHSTKQNNVSISLICLVLLGLRTEILGGTETHIYQVQGRLKRHRGIYIYFSPGGFCVPACTACQWTWNDITPSSAHRGWHEHIIPDGLESDTMWTRACLRVEKHRTRRATVSWITAL